MFEPKIRIARALYEQLEKQAAEKGYSSVAEFVTHVLETVVAADAPTATAEQVRQRLRGLGYLK